MKIQGRWAFSLVLSAFFSLSLTLSLSGCSAVRSTVAACRSTDHFVIYSLDARVLYEPGAAAFAPEVASALPSAIEKVESAQYLPFSAPVHVYLCSSDESYYKLTGTTARAVVTSKLFLSRTLLAEPNLVPLYLTHELSHLHLLKCLGILRFQGNLPSWFTEGLAALVSDGGGAERVSDSKAIEAINQGQTFIPDEGRGVLASLLFPRYGSYWNLEQQMFYHQAMLFVDFLRKKDKAAFKRLLLDIQSGLPFSVSLSNSYGMSLADLWNLFLQEIKAKV